MPITKINYYNKGRLISSSKLTLPIETVTQEKVNFAMPLIIDVLTDDPPTDAHVIVTVGRKEVLRFEYTGEEVKHDY